MYGLYMGRKNIFIFFADGGGHVAREEESGDFYALLYGRGTLAAAAMIVLAAILFTIWE